MPDPSTSAIPNIFSAPVIADPYPAYAALRSVGVARDENNDLWLLTRHAHVLEALHNPTVFSSAGGYGEFMSGRIGPNAGGDRATALGFDQVLGSRVLIASDPPDHTTLRRVVSRPFTKRTISTWESMARTLADRLVDALVHQIDVEGSADFTQDLAIPLPVTLIAEILGIPAERMRDFRRWSEALVGSLAAEVDLSVVGADMGEMSQYFWEIAEKRRVAPGHDLISQIAMATPDGEELSTIEVVMFCILVLVAGNETTTNLLGNVQYAFWAQPDQWQRLIDDPSLASAAVEEGLRHGGPVQGLFRRTTAAYEIGGVEIPEHANVYLGFAAANRDEDVFPDGDRFDVGREVTEQLAFGHGIHYCLGSQLARLETHVVFEALASRGLMLAPAGAPVPTANPVLRGFSSIPVTIDR
jgi:cytochrome P450